MPRDALLETNIITIRRCLIVIAAVAALWALERFESFLLPTFIALFLALILTPVVTALEERGVPRGPAAAGLVLAVLIGLASLVYAVLPSYEDYRDRGPEIVREIERKLAPIAKTAVDAGMVEDPKESDGEDAADENEPSNVMEDRTDAPSDDEKKAGEIVTDAVSDASRSFYADIALGTPAVFGTLLYVVILTFFTVYDRHRLMRMALATQSTFYGRLWLARLIRDTRTAVSRYLLLITVINTMLGIVTGLVFWGLGMPNPVLWGAGMAAMNFIPYLGAVIVNILVFAVAFVHYPTLGMALLPVGALLLLNTIEGQILTPMIVGARVRASSLPVFVAVAFGAWLWGPVGALLATPALIVVQTLISKRHSARRAYIALQEERAAANRAVAEAAQ